MAERRRAPDAGRSMSSRSRWIAVALALSVSACAVGPNYRRPPVPVTPAYRGAEATEAAATAQSIADVPWWELFQDPALGALIDEALVSGYDARIAAVRVEQARYAVGVTRADLMPQVSYEGTANRGKSFNPFGGPNVTGNVFFAGIQMAWEIDVWGRIRRATEASLANLVAQEDVQRGVVLSLVTGIAQAYFELRELDLELEIALRTRDSFQQTLDLFTRQLLGGIGNKLATARAAAALANTAAAIPELERQIVAKENQIAILLGRPPGPIERGATLTEQKNPPEVPAGLPASLVERRPDVLATEQAIVASNAIVGVSIGNFLPRVGLTSLYGAQSSDLDNILKGSATVWNVGASVLGPLFQGGRLYYDYKANVSQREIAALAYQQTVLNALGEVSNALVARAKLAEERLELEKEVVALQDSVRLATLRYTGGFASYYEVLEAQQQLFPAENALARTELSQLVAFVQLYRALGGGWEAEEARHPERYPIRRDPLDAIVPGGGRAK